MTALVDIPIKACLAPLTTAEIKWLLLLPDSNGVSVKARVKENPSRDAKGLAHHIKAGLSLVCTAKSGDHNSFRIRLYDEHPVMRLIIVDETAYFSYYPKGPANTVPVFIVKRGQTWLFDALSKYYDTVWERAEEYDACPKMHTKAIRLTDGCS